MPKVNKSKRSTVVEGKDYTRKKDYGNIKKPTTKPKVKLGY